MDEPEPEEPEPEFVEGIAARLPRKRVAAGALLRDGDGRILLVEPVYKPTWELPGGVVEADEPPLDACRRELLEELGLAPEIGRLLVVDWVPRRGPWHDGVMFVFDGGVLSDAQLAGVRLPADELRAVHRTTLPEAAPHLLPLLARRIAAALDVVDDPLAPPQYLHEGRVPDAAGVTRRRAGAGS